MLGTAGLAKDTRKILKIAKATKKLEKEDVSEEGSVAKEF